MKAKCIVSILVLFIYIIQLSCNREKGVSFSYFPPKYDSLEIFASDDTIHFMLDENTYNNIRSFNYFIDRDREYVSFYDKQSLTINIYDLNSKQLVERMPLRRLLPGRPLEKHTTAYCKNLDSLYVVNNIFLYLFNRKGSILDSIVFDAGSILAFPAFEKKNPPLFKGHILFLSAKPYLSTSREKEIRKWKTIYKVDLNDKSTMLEYSLPNIYLRRKFNLYFFENSYCINSEGRFVFSFAADANIYETDFDDYHMSYLGRSSFQRDEISPVDPKEIEEVSGLRKSFLIRDSYDAIYFDPYNKIYLRVAEQKIAEGNMNKYIGKSKSVILFDKKFQIIGESKIDSTLSFNTAFFSKSGFYVRVNVRDEQGIHFVKMTYHSKGVAERLSVR